MLHRRVPPRLEIIRQHPPSEIRIHASGMSEFVPGLYVGHSGSPADPAIVHCGIRTVISLCPPAGLPPADVMHHFIPFPDYGGGIDVQDLAYLALIVRAARRRGPVLVHCYMGVSRAPTVAMAAMLLDDMPDADFPEVLLRARESRPQVDPNRGFVELLSELVEARDGRSRALDATSRISAARAISHSVLPAQNGCTAHDWFTAVVTATVCVSVCASMFIAWGCN
jgi:hypothetical protein